MKGDSKNLNSNSNIKFVFAPINIGIAKHGIIDKHFIDFYSERSGKKIDLTYVGNVAINEEYSTNFNTPFFVDTNLLEWGKLVEKIHYNGSQAGVQLGCRYYTNPALRKNTVQAQGTYVEKMITFIKNLDVTEIEKIIDEFVASSLIAAQLNFDWIQIHAAHGYFLSLLLSPEINKREDKYNYDDLHVIDKIVKGIRTCFKEIKIDIRISLLEGINSKEREFLERKSLISKLVEMDLDMISFSNGLYDYDKQLIYPSQKDGFLPMYELAKFFLIKYPNMAWNFSGNVNDIDKIRQLSTHDNLSLSIGRALIADPEFLLLFDDGNKQRRAIESPCNFCGSCHYYSNNETKLRCPQYQKKYNKQVLL